MNILHYMPGIPPVRGGGLVRYASDLMEQEQNMGNAVQLLLPGPLSFCKHRPVKLRAGRLYRNVQTYEILHPLPVPMSHGILEVDIFTRSCDAGLFEDFLRQLRPDIIHIHSFMGLYREFLSAAQTLRLPVLFTTHDYFGICPAATLCFAGHICSDQSWQHCRLCCRNAYPRSRLWLEQSGWYRHYRQSSLLTGLFRKGIRHRLPKLWDIQTADAGENAFSVQETGAGYSGLKKYYEEMFGMVTYFHFNSSLARKMYEVRLGNLSGSIVPVSHMGIGDHRRRHACAHRLRIGYFGIQASYKGYDQILDACVRLSGEGFQELELHLYSDAQPQNQKEAFIKNHPCFRPDQMQQVLEEIDVLAVPSRCPETFGLVVLEAVSYGVPVILSASVGATDLLVQNPGIGFVYDGTTAGLKQCIKNIYMEREMLQQANNRILEMDYDFRYEKHVEKILKLYDAARNRTGNIKTEFGYGQTKQKSRHYRSCI